MISKIWQGPAASFQATCQVQQPSTRPYRAALHAEAGWQLLVNTQTFRLVPPGCSSPFPGQGWESAKFSLNTPLACTHRSVHRSCRHRSRHSPARPATRRRQVQALEGRRCVRTRPRRSRRRVVATSRSAPSGSGEEGPRRRTASRPASACVDHATLHARNVAVRCLAARLPVERVDGDADPAGVRVQLILAEAAAEVIQEGRLVQVVELCHVLHSSLGEVVHELELFSRHDYRRTGAIVPPQRCRASFATVDHGRLVPRAVESRGVRQPRAHLS